MSRPDDVNSSPGVPALAIVQDGRYRGHAVSIHARREGDRFLVDGCVDEHGEHPLRWSSGGFDSLQAARDVGVLATRALVDALEAAKQVDPEAGVGLFESDHRPSRKQLVDAELNTLAWQLHNELVPQYPDDADFWPAFAGLADVIEDRAGDHAQYVSERIDAMLAEAGKALPPGV